MRAVVCKDWGGPETLTVEDVPARDPSGHDVKIRVRAAGVNFPDLLMIQGKYQVKPERPFIPGAELAGEVMAVGPDVTAYKAGDRVVAFCNTGGFAEEAMVAEQHCLPLPGGIDWAVAGGFTLAYGTSWHALRDRAVLRAGETMLVLGAAGGVGLAAVEIGHAMGARVIAAASTAAKLEACRGRGADAALNYATEELRPALAKLAPEGPDVIYDPLGGRFTEPAFRSIGWQGRHLMVGFAGGQIPALPANLPLLKGAALVGVFWGGYIRKQPAHWRESAAELFDWLATGRLRPVVSHRFPLEQVAEAMAVIGSRQVIGKVVILP